MSGMSGTPGPIRSGRSLGRCGTKTTVVSSGVVDEPCGRTAVRRYNSRYTTSLYGYLERVSSFSLDAVPHQWHGLTMVRQPDLHPSTGGGSTVRTAATGVDSTGAEPL